MTKYGSRNLMQIHRSIRDLLPLDLIVLIRGIFSFLSVSSLFIGCTGFFNTYIGYILLGMEPQIHICFAVFLVSFSVYTLDKITDIDKDAACMPARAALLRGRKKLAIAYSSLAYVLSAIILFLGNPISATLVLVPIAANVVYGTKLIPGIPRLKDIPVMKNAIVAFSWALVTIMIPVTYNFLPQSCHFFMPLITVLYFMFIKMFINTVLYDIRDESGDKINNVRTIPVLIGSKNTTKVLLALNSTLFLGLRWVDGLSRLLILSLTFYGYFYILYFGEPRDPLALDLCVDGEFLIASLFVVTIGALLS